MFGSNFTLFRVLGFEVRANVSWLFLAILVTWSLAAGFFPATYPGLTPGTYWSLGIIGMIGLFFSLLFHELSHSLVARTQGLEMRGITLFLFGGVAEMPAEPATPRAEFWMAIAGPVSSVVLAGIFYLIALGLHTAGLAKHVVGLVQYLSLINVALAVFNMVPGFPLDGGRVLRAVLWHLKGDLRWATRWATRLGQGFGLMLVGLGVINAFQGNLTVGLWWFLIGLFLQGAATSSYQRLIMQEGLSGETVAGTMTRDPISVPPDITIRDFIEDYLYRYSHDLFPVVADGRLLGCVDMKDVHALPRERREFATVSEIAERCGETNTIEPGAAAEEALVLMQKSGNARLIVAENGRLVGILTLKDLLHRLAVRSEFGRDR